MPSLLGLLCYLLPCGIMIPLIQHVHATTCHVCRALEKMQGTSKRAVLMAWMSWAAAQQHKRAAIARALAHWQRSYLASAFNTWREWARLAQVRGC
jgi:hypothetical protein